MDFKEKLKRYQNDVNEYIDALIPNDYKFIGTIMESMRYSVFAGGKRLRPVLVLGVGEIFECPVADLMPYAAGIELIHTYSLIHDDLPAMDNDNYRRGKPTNHMVYGEAMAILAGDGLLNMAFELMLEYSAARGDVKYIQAAADIARASGIYGMIGGQSVDIENEGKSINVELLEYMHNNKTGALITAAARAGAIISGASNEDLNRLTQYARDLGLAFQIIDDILDVTGDEKKLGKKIHSDIDNNKATHVSLYGLNKSNAIAKELSQNALDRIKHYGRKAEFLSQLTEFLLYRNY